MSYSEFTAVKGIRNDVSLDRFKTGDLAYAKNVDLDESGRAQSRLGSTLLYAGAAHSAWSDGAQGYFVQSGSLNRFAAGVAPAAVAAVTGTRVAYAYINGDTFWSDNVTSGIVRNGVNKLWGITPPDKLIPVGGYGGLPGGSYLCTMTYVDREGRESGAPMASIITFPPFDALAPAAGHSISFSELSVSTNPNVIAKNIYISAPGGDTPYLVGTIANVTTTFLSMNIPHYGIAIRTALWGPPPAGQVVGYYNGRAYVAQGRFLWYSQPYEFELFNQSTGWFAFDSDIQTFSAVRDGVYIGTKTRTYFLNGPDADSFVRQQVAEIGTALGTELSVRVDAIGSEEIKGSQVEGNAVMWATLKGSAVVGTNGGVIRDMTINRFIPPVQISQGGALLKWRDGTPQYVASLFS